MKTYGVLCDATGFVVYVGPAADPREACVRATQDAGGWDSLGPFHRGPMSPAQSETGSWLELSVYDLGDMPAKPGVDSEDPEVLAAMTEDVFIEQYIARQY